MFLNKMNLKSALHDRFVFDWENIISESHKYTDTNQGNQNSLPFNNLHIFNSPIDTTTNKIIPCEERELDIETDETGKLRNIID